jgi:hypothetical protein
MDIVYSNLYTGYKYLKFSVLSACPNFSMFFASMKLGCRTFTFTIHNIIWVTFPAIPRDISVGEETLPIGNEDV